MGDHDVSVDGDGEDVEDGDPEEAVPQEGVELAELRAPDPPLGQELGGGQGQVEAAEEEVGHGEVDDEDGGGVPDLLAPDQGQDGDDVAREAADEEHDAADEGRHEHPVRVPLAEISRLASSSPLDRGAHLEQLSGEELPPVWSIVQRIVLRTRFSDGEEALRRLIHLLRVDVSFLRENNFSSDSRLDEQWT